MLSNYILPSAFPENKIKVLPMPAAGQLEKYVGRYQFGEDEFRCYHEKGALYLRDSRNPPLPLTFLGNNRFYGIYGQLLRVNCTFHSDKTGNVTGMTSSFGFRKNHTPKITD